MTGSVSIVYLRKDNVLVVPNSAIKAQGRNRVVDVLVDGKTETRTVTVGAADDKRTEIVEGLQEGDQVLLPATTSSTVTTAGQGMPSPAAQVAYRGSAGSARGRQEVIEIDDYTRSTIWATSRCTPCAASRCAWQQGSSSPSWGPRARASPP